MFKLEAVQSELLISLTRPSPLKADIQHRLHIDYTSYNLFISSHYLVLFFLNNVLQFRAFFCKKILTSEQY